MRGMSMTKEELEELFNKGSDEKYMKMLEENLRKGKEIQEIKREKKIQEIEMYIEHIEADLRAHAKDVRRKTAQAEEDIKKILKERW